MLDASHHLAGLTQSPKLTEIIHGTFSWSTVISRCQSLPRDSDQPISRGKKRQAAHTDSRSLSDFLHENAVFPSDPIRFNVTYIYFLQCASILYGVPRMSLLAQVRLKVRIAVNRVRPDPRKSDSFCLLLYRTCLTSVGRHAHVRFLSRSTITASPMAHDHDAAVDCYTV